MRCDICNDTKFVRLPSWPDLSPIDPWDATNAVPSAGASLKTFDCPQCVPKVPYRRVRAMKVVAAYQAEEWGKMQVPIERSLAARFGEYLMREGLIRFTTTGSADLGPVSDKITVTAHLGVVSREDVKTAGALAEVATAETMPKIPMRLAKRARLNPETTRAWKPAPWTGDPEQITDEFDEPKSANDSRFSGLDI